MKFHNYLNDREYEKYEIKLKIFYIINRITLFEFIFFIFSNGNKLNQS